MKNLLYCISFLLLPLTLFAQSSGSKSVTSTITLMIPEAIDLEVTAGNSIEFDFTANLSSLVAGIEKLNSVILSYKSNVPWYLSISASSVSFSGGDPSKPMPVSIVQFRRNGTDLYASLSTVPSSLSGTSTAKNQRGSSTIGIDYKIVPGFEYPSANDYSIGIAYTISSI